LEFGVVVVASLVTVEKPYHSAFVGDGVDAFLAAFGVAVVAAAVFDEESGLGEWEADAVVEEDVEAVVLEAVSVAEVVQVALVCPEC